jgi:hypothetical protein
MKSECAFVRQLFEDNFLRDRTAESDKGSNPLALSRLWNNQNSAKRVRFRDAHLATNSNFGPSAEDEPGKETRREEWAYMSGEIERR